MFQHYIYKSWVTQLQVLFKFVKIGGRENLMGLKVHEEKGVTFFDVQDIQVMLKMKKK